MHNTESDKLELIALNDSIISFSRLYANAVRYYHWHQCLELLYVEEGAGVMIANNRHYTMRPGRLFIFPPFTLHKIMVEDGARERYRRTIIHLDHNTLLRSLEGFPQAHSKLIYLTRRSTEALALDLEELHPWLDTLFKRYEQFSCDHALTTESVTSLLLTLFTMLPPLDTGQYDTPLHLSTQAMLWIEEHYQEKFSLDRLATDLNKSPGYISRRFHMETGEKLHNYLATFRLRKACELLLRTEEPMGNIAEKVGFSDTTYFISSFKKGIGMTPLQYRKNNAHHP